jgi:hypothetical protein
MSNSLSPTYAAKEELVVRCWLRAAQVCRSVSHLSPGLPGEVGNLLCWLHTVWHARQWLRVEPPWPGMNLEDLAYFGLEPRWLEPLLALGLVYQDGSYYLLTPAGMNLGPWPELQQDEAWIGPVAAALSQPDGEQQASDGEGRPHYDARRHELRCGARLLRKFNRSAPNQEAVLEAFQAKDWADWVANPLEGDDQAERLARLRQTLKDLNAGLKSGPIYFFIGGEGGARWRRSDD